MSTYIQEAYQQVCKDAVKPTDGVWLTLYCSYPFYGGRKADRWWGQDTVVVKESKFFQFNDKAEKTKVLVDQTATDMNILAKRAYGSRCLEECQWLDERGLDPDYFPEPDGEERYFVVIESEQGAQEQRGDRYSHDIN